MKTILITGVAGFIGMHSAIKFLQSGYTVIGLDNVNNYYSKDLKNDRIIEVENAALVFGSKFIMVEADLNSDVWVQIQAYNIDSILHLAAQAGVRYSLKNPNSYIESNVLGFQKILDFAVENKIETLLYASSSSVYGKHSVQPFNELQNCSHPESLYAATKKANELQAYSYYNTHQLKSVGLRFFTVYGPWGRPDMAPFLFVDAAYNNTAINVFNYGKQKRDFTYIDDIVEGIYRIHINRKKIENAIVMNIGSGSPIKLMEFIAEIERATGRSLMKKMVPAQEGDVEETFADTKFFQDFTNYKVRFSFEEGIHKFVSWYSKYYYEKK